MSQPLRPPPPPPTAPLELRWGDAGPGSPAAAVEYRPIVSTEDPYRPPLATPVEGTLTHYGDLGRTGRLGATLPAGPLKEVFRVDASHPPGGSAVLTAGKRIFSDSEQWTLLDTRGKLIDRGVRGHGPALLDPGRKVITLPLHSSGQAALQELGLKKGESLFQTSVTGSGHSRVPLCARVGKTYLAVTSDELRDPLGGAAPDATAVVTFSVEGKIDPSGFPARQPRGSTLRVNRSAVQVAMHEETLVLAAEASLLFVRVGALPESLVLAGAFSAPFLAQSLSVDEAGRAHLVAGVAGKSELWVVDGDGRRWLREAFGRPVRPVQPPLVGLDHRIFLIETDRITALKPGGGIAWHHPAHQVAGASITPDGVLLVAADRELLAYAVDGSRRVVHTLVPAEGSPDDPLRTPPVIAADGTVLLGCATAVIGLRPGG